MSFWGYAWIFISIVAIIAIIQSIKINKKKKEMWSRLKSIPDFNPTQQIMGCDGTSRIAVDESNKKFVLSLIETPLSYRD